MNTEKVKQQLQLLKEIDVRQRIIDAHPDTKMEDIRVGEWPLAKFSHQYRRMVNQLEDFLKRSAAEYLSEHLLIPEFDPNTNSLSNYLEHLKKKTEEKDWGEVLRSLKWLIGYQHFYDFWDRSQEKLHDTDTLKLQEAKETLELSLKETQRLETLLQDKINRYEQKSQELSQFFDQKKGELESITGQRDEINRKVNESNDELNRIKDYKREAENTRNEVISVTGEAKRVLDEANSRFENTTKEWAEIKNHFNEDFKNIVDALKSQENTNAGLIRTLESQIKSYDNMLEQAHWSYDIVQKKAEEAQKLIAFIADASLSHSFNQRSEKLRISARFWRWFSIGATVVLLVWIFLVFTYLTYASSDPWVTLLVNALKTIPAFLVLAFVTRQYTKERNLQEEYAFKSAIAMTLTAYADEIARETDADRREIIKHTIEKVYRSPRITLDRFGLFGGMSGRQKKEYFETLTQTLKDTLEKVNELKNTKP